MQNIFVLLPMLALVAQAARTYDIRTRQPGSSFTYTTEPTAWSGSGKIFSVETRQPGSIISMQQGAECGKGAKNLRIETAQKGSDILMKLEKRVFREMRVRPEDLSQERPYYLMNEEEVPEVEVIRPEERTEERPIIPMVFANAPVLQEIGVTRGLEEYPGSTRVFSPEEFHGMARELGSEGIQGINQKEALPYETVGEQALPNVAEETEEEHLEKRALNLERINAYPNVEFVPREREWAVSPKFAKSSVFNLKTFTGDKCESVHELGSRVKLEHGASGAGAMGAALARSTKLETFTGDSERKTHQLGSCVNAKYGEARANKLMKRSRANMGKLETFTGIRRATRKA